MSFKIIDKSIIDADKMVLNMGPQHPSTHGVLRLKIVTDGEIVSSVEPIIGYLHRCFEKHCEYLTYSQILPFTDRCDYLASMHMTHAFSMSVEKLLDIEIPERVEYIRVIVAELQRIASHLVSIGVFGLDVGAITPFTWTLRDRERILDLFEALCGLGELSHNIQLIRNVIVLKERVAQATWKSGRSIDEVQLLAVSKKHAKDQVECLLDCNQNHFGESYFQELIDKSAQVNEKARNDLEWHYIGALQSKKAKRIGELVHWVHGLTRSVEAEKLAQGARQLNRTIKAFIQVNLSAETSKSGLRADEVEPLLDHCQKIDGIEVVGLMTFPPLAAPEDNRRYFRELKILRDHLELAGFSLPHLSMGTSDDFEVAIEEGATWVRLGRCLFGDRH